MNADRRLSAFIGGFFSGDDAARNPLEIFDHPLYDEPFLLRVPGHLFRLSEPNFEHEAPPGYQPRFCLRNQPPEGFITGLAPEYRYLWLVIAHRCLNGFHVVARAIG